MQTFEQFFEPLYVPKESVKIQAWEFEASFNWYGSTPAVNPIILDSNAEPESNKEVCSWMGGVNNHFEDNPEDWADSSNLDSESDDVEIVTGIYQYCIYCIYYISYIYCFFTFIVYNN